MNHAYCLDNLALIMAEQGAPWMQVQLPGMSSRRMHAAQLSRNEVHAALLAQQRQTNHVQILTDHSASERANNVEDQTNAQLEALLTSGKHDSTSVCRRRSSVLMCRSF